jgi:hypothetical protein
MIPLKRDIASNVRRFGDTFRQSLFSSAIRGSTWGGVGPLDADAEVAVSRLTMDRLDVSEPVLVGADVMDELLKRYHGAEPFRAGSVAPFADKGFAWFSRPINIGSALSDKHQAWISGISWGIGMVPTWNDMRVIHKPGIAVVAWLSASHHGFAGMVAGDEEDNRARFQDMGLVAAPIAYSVAANGGWFRREQGWEIMSQDPDAVVFYDGARGDEATGSNLMTLVHTLWTMLDERVLVRAKVPLGRKDLRTAKRAGFGDRYVSTIHLRAREYVGDRYGGGGSREFQYQFPVREHVRTLHRGTAKERHVMVRSYVKGPRDKPFRDPERVYSLDR